MYEMRYTEGITRLTLLFSYHHYFYVLKSETNPFYIDKHTPTWIKIGTI